MNKMEILAEISEKHGGIIETKIASQYGVSRASLSMYCKQNRIKRIDYGVYTLVEKEKDYYLYLAQSSDKFVFSHETALFLHNIITDEPMQPSITVPSGITPSVILSSSCDVYYIKRELAELGKIMVTTAYGNEVPVYDVERTICDMVRSCKRVGEEKILQVIKSYLSNESIDVKKLFDYAEKLRISLRLYKFWNQAKEEMKEHSVLKNSLDK